MFRRMRSIMALLRQVSDTDSCARLAESLHIRRLQWMQEQLACIPNGQRVLEVGERAGVYAANLEHCEYLYTRLEQLPDSMFDAVICSVEIEVLPDPAAALQHLVAMLRPGGLLLYTAASVLDTEHDTLRQFSLTRRWHLETLERLQCQMQDADPCAGMFALTAFYLQRTRVSSAHVLRRIPRLARGVFHVLAFNLPIVFLWQMERRIAYDTVSAGHMVAAIRSENPEK